MTFLRFLTCAYYLVIVLAQSLKFFSHDHPCVEVSGCVEVSVSIERRESIVMARCTFHKHPTKSRTCMGTRLANMLHTYIQEN